jgi:DNA-binding CsgD family transcriptional regulator
VAPSELLGPRRLFGRERETEILDGVIARAREAGSALVIRGDPGIGKSALLAAAAATARIAGFQVLTAAGVQSEAELPFAGLHQLTHSLSEEAEALPTPQRAALLAALGRTGGAAPDLFLVALAALGLLVEVSGRQPLLVIAEDAQWLDRATSSVLAFVARRLEADPIVVLFAVRDGAGSMLLQAGLPELRPGALGEDDARKLLEAAAPELKLPMRRRVLTEARGNPLALVELPAAMRSAPESDISISSEPLQLTARLESAFGGRLTDFSDATRTALLVAAIDDSPDAAEILRAAGVMGRRRVSVDVLAPAEAAGLIELGATDLRFHHPLVRSAIRRSASLADRLAAHAALATALEHDADRRAWHRAAALIGRDEDAAADLEAAAARARARGALLVSVDALRRAIELTPDPARRAGRLLRAAENAFEVGHRETVTQLVEQVEPLLPLVRGPRERARIALVRGLGEPRVLPVERLRSLVDLAEGARRAGDANLGWNLLWRLAQRCFWADPGPDARAVVVAAAEKAGSAAPDARELAVLAYAAPLERSGVVIEGIAGWPGERSPEEARLLGSAAVVVGAFELSMPLLAASVGGLRAQGRLAHLARALAMQGWSALCLADWKVAIPALDEAVRMAAETGEGVWGAGAEAMEAIMAAIRGDPDAAAALALQAETAVISTGATHMLAYIQAARGLAAMAGGRSAAAYQELRRIYEPSDPAHHRVPSCWYIGELAEAGIQSGHAEEVRAVMNDLRPLLAASPSSWIRSAFSYARAQLAAEEEAEEAFEAAISESSRWPFQRARLQLCRGSWLRRQRRVTEARAALRSARDAFDALGALPWAERARQELRAAGETSRKRAPEAWDRLSPQEMQIASLAADGLSNREIAQRLYLSHRTVGSHLYRLFPKLGVTSRAQLVSVLRGSDSLTSPRLRSYSGA